MSKVTVVIQHGQDKPQLVAESFTRSSLVDHIIILSRSDINVADVSMTFIKTDQPNGDKALHAALEKVQTDYILIMDGAEEIELGQLALERMVDVAEQTNAGMVYADHLISNEKEITRQPLIEYQLGSLRDNFDFGPLRLYSNAAIKTAFRDFSLSANIQWNASYDLRLKVSVNHTLVHISEALYTIKKVKVINGEQEHFAYVDPNNLNVQNELETVATEHLRRINAYLPPEFDAIPQSSDTFEVEASVVIPVRNRERTIANALDSAASQKTTFPFNVIVVDNHSTDGTTEIIRKKVDENPQIVHMIPSRTDLGIGGCWNEAIMSSPCGRYCVQLDSDDLYSDQNVLERIVGEFGRGPYAMVVGSYRVVDFELNELPPGVVDHREWSRENGRNNLLRVNGLGAPRAFLTSLLRQHPFPNVSYGEDYAVGLRMSRKYEIGRIHDPVYLCRRWEDNSDARLPVEKVNEYNLYKDRLRTIEILARQKMNRRNQE